MSYLFLLGRILFGGFFLYNAYRHLVRGKGMIGYAQSKGVPAPWLAIYGSGVLILIGGLSVITGLYVTLGLWAIIIFLVPVTLTMHAYWKEFDMQMRSMQHIQFMKNTALLGAALMMLVIPAPWPFSL